MVLPEHVTPTKGGKKLRKKEWKNKKWWMKLLKKYNLNHNPKSKNLNNNNKYKTQEYRRQYLNLNRDKNDPSISYIKMMLYKII